MKKVLLSFIIVTGLVSSKAVAQDLESTFNITTTVTAHTFQVEIFGQNDMDTECPIDAGVEGDGMQRVLSDSDPISLNVSSETGKSYLSKLRVYDASGSNFVEVSFCDDIEEDVPVILGDLYSGQYEIVFDGDDWEIQ